MKYRKKPVVIEAFKWTGEPDQTEDTEWIAAAIEEGIIWFADVEGIKIMYIGTLEGTHMARSGDFVIQGVKGELYPCKPGIFEATYEPVE